MEVTFGELKKKDVVSVTDGKNLGRVCDVTLSSDHKVVGYTATGTRGFCLNKQEVYFPVSAIRRIGEDAVLVDLSPKPFPPCRPCPPCDERRDMGEYE